jgi:uncharacterized protein (DUF885 family)
MRRRLLAPVLLLCAARPVATAEPGIKQFFERFTAEWVRAEPQMATRNQYFSGAEQDRLDRQLTSRTSSHRKARIERARRGLAELRRFDRKQLSGSQRISARVLEWQLESIVQGSKYEGHQYTFNQGIAGFPRTTIQFLTDIHPARNARDIENYLARLTQLPVKIDEAIADARKTAANGIIPPRFILTATIGQIDRLAAPDPGKNVLVEQYADRIEKVGTITAAEKQQFRESAAKLVATSVVPALRRIIVMLEEQHKIATDDAGFSKLPDGAGAYAVRLRESTSTSLTADQIHRIGLEQVARIEGQMDKLLQQLGYKTGSVKDRYAKALDDYSYADVPDVRAKILADYEAIIREADQRSSGLFDLKPKAQVVVRRIPEYQERNAAANYSAPARDGSRPGSFNVPLVGPKFSRLGMRTLAYHEAIPGHHFQIALQQEDKELPRFRADMLIREGVGAFVEGWGLYAEMLAMENGWHGDDIPSRLGALQAQLFRARRLVVDTGLHTKAWTRQQAIDYGMSVSETERYVAAPGQACSYMIGQLKILELRDKARRELGDKFSLKAFHNVVLRTGMVPLEVLEEVVNEHIASK